MDALKCRGKWETSTHKKRAGSKRHSQLPAISKPWIMIMALGGDRSYLMSSHWSELALALLEANKERSHLSSVRKAAPALFQPPGVCMWLLKKAAARNPCLLPISIESKCISVLSQDQPPPAVDDLLSTPYCCPTINGGKGSNEWQDIWTHSLSAYVAALF